MRAAQVAFQVVDGGRLSGSWAGGSRLIVFGAGVKLFANGIGAVASARFHGGGPGSRATAGAAEDQRRKWLLQWLFRA
jgi:hypothetical protein